MPIPRHPVRYEHPTLASTVMEINENYPVPQRFRWSSASLAELMNSNKRRRVGLSDDQLKQACEQGTITTIRADKLGELHRACTEWVLRHSKELINRGLCQFKPMSDARYSVCLNAQIWPSDDLRALPMVQHQRMTQYQALHAKQEFKRCHALQFNRDCPGTTFLQVGRCTIIGGSAVAANSEIYQNVEHITGIYSLCSKDDPRGSCFIIHAGTKATIEACFDINLLFTEDMRFQDLLESVLTPIWDKLFTALAEAHHGKGPFCEDNILLHCHHGENRTPMAVSNTHLTLPTKSKV